MKIFLKKFFKKNRKNVILLSLLRTFSFVQDLFWPFGLSKIVNIMTETPEKWQEALLWAAAITINAALADLTRLRSKYGLENLGTKLRISLTSFFSERAEIGENKKTGQALEAVRRTSEYVNNLANFYKENGLIMPVNFIIVPLIFLRTNLIYFLILFVYCAIYLLLDLIYLKKYKTIIERYMIKSEIFWGTTYRKTPEVWRKREDGKSLTQEIEREGDDLYKATVLANNMGKWRWFAIQALSSLSIGGAIAFVVYRIATNGTHVGDLVLVNSYFSQMQTTLNVLTTALTQFVETKTSLARLNGALKVK